MKLHKAALLNLLLFLVGIVFIAIILIKTLLKNGNSRFTQLKDSEERAYNTIKTETNQRGDYSGRTHPAGHRFLRVRDVVDDTTQRSGFSAN